MAYNIRALEDLGTIPSEKLASGQLSYSKRIEWLLKPVILTTWSNKEFQEYFFNFQAQKKTGWKNFQPKISCLNVFSKT